jgi:hypothetical protein
MATLGIATLSFLSSSEIARLLARAVTGLPGITPHRLIDVAQQPLVLGGLLASWLLMLLGSIAAWWLLARRVESDWNDAGS